jgi:16S rRNA processing protein RimM
MTRVGQVLTAHGTDGAVKVLPLTDFSDRFDRGARLLLEGAAREVEWSRTLGGHVLLKLRGIDNRTMAELIRGRYLEVDEEAARPAGEGRFYHHQLIGLPVTTAAGRPMGQIAEVLERPANDVWVAREDSIEHLIPATRDAVIAVDLDARKVVVADWLLEVEDAK